MSRTVSNFKIPHKVVINYGQLDPFGYYIPEPDQKHVFLVSNTFNDSFETFYRRIDQKRFVGRTLYSEYFRLRRQRLYRTLRTADAVMANSGYNRSFFRKYIPFDIPIRAFHKPMNIRQFESGGDDDYFLYLGRLIPLKRVDEIIELFETRFSEEKLVIAGSGQLEDYVTRKAGQNDNIEYRGWVEGERKVETLSNARALILNSEDESFGTVMVEAFASGCPVIGVNSGNIPYLISDGRTGVVYENGELERGIEQFLQVEEQLDKRKMVSIADDYREENALVEIEEVCQSVF